MLKTLERRITLQLLVFYGLFVLPLLLGGVELYLFQRNALQQSAQQADLGLAQAIALEADSNVRAAAEEAVDLSKSQAARDLDSRQLTPIFATARLSHPAISLYAAYDVSGRLLLNYPSGQRTIAQDAGFRALFQKALSSAQPCISAGWMRIAPHEYVISIAARIAGSRGQPVGVMMIYLSLEQFTAHLITVRTQLANSSEVRIWIVDGDGKPLANTEGVSPEVALFSVLPGLKNALAGKSGNLIAPEQRRDWLYSYVPIAGTGWAVVVQRPTDITFATVITFQNSLILALVMLIVGASLFWFVMHGWVVAPLSRLAQAATQIKPDQTLKVTDGKLLAKDRGRSDEIGRLIAAFSTMEDEIHILFRQSDEESQARLHTLDAIMRSMDEGVLLESPEGQVVYVNRRFLQFVGLLPQEMLLASFKDSRLPEKMLALVLEPDTYLEAVRRAESGSGPLVVEFHARGYYNQVGQLVPSRRDIRMRLFQVRDQAGQLIGRGKIFQDVTRQNEAEQVKKNLLAIVSHELRTPLTAIKGYATSLLETDVVVDEALQARFLRHIVDESDRMADIVTSLLEMSQLEAGTLRLNPALYRLPTLFERAVPAHEQQRVRITLPTDLPLLYVDRRRMEVVFRNLLENARRYAGDDASIEISASFEPSPDDGGLFLRVTDTGPGIPVDLTERIFERFYQIDGGRKRSSGGVGLGLAICRGFIEAHGGRVWAENRTDGVTGAVFHIWLPSKVLHTQGPQQDQDLSHLDLAP